MAQRDPLQELRNSMEVELMEIEQGGAPTGDRAREEDEDDEDGLGRKESWWGGGVESSLLGTSRSGGVGLSGQTVYQANELGRGQEQRGPRLPRPVPHQLRGASWVPHPSRQQERHLRNRP